MNKVVKNETNKNEVLHYFYSQIFSSSWSFLTLAWITVYLFFFQFILARYIITFYIVASHQN